MNKHMIETKINSLTRAAKNEIEHPDFGNRGKRLVEISDSMIRIKKQIENSRENVNFFNKMKLQRASRNERYRIQQSRHDKLRELMGLEFILASAWAEILTALKDREAKSPLDGKSMAELLHSLSDNMEDLAQNLKSIQTHFSSHQMHGNASIAVISEIPRINYQHDPQFTDYIMMFAMLLRLASMLNCKK